MKSILKPSNIVRHKFSVSLPRGNTSKLQWLAFEETVNNLIKQNRKEAIRIAKQYYKWGIKDMNIHLIFCSDYISGGAAGFGPFPSPKRWQDEICYGSRINFTFDIRRK